LDTVVFCTLLYPQDDEQETLWLAESLREFGGEYSRCPLVACCRGGLDGISSQTRMKLERLGVELSVYGLDGEIPRIPLVAKTWAAAQVEASLAGKAEWLVFLDPDTLFLQEPHGLLPGTGKSCGYVPVMHKLIGSAWESGADAFWQHIYSDCNVPETRIFPVETPVDGRQIRAYFNAGLLCVRPERGLFSAWRDAIARLVFLPHYEQFYSTDPIYSLFIHQAILAGVLLTALEPHEFQCLPKGFNYPLHLHHKIPAHKRLGVLNHAITCRYDELALLKGFDWSQMPQVQEPLLGWMKEHMGDLAPGAGG